MIALHDEWLAPLGFTLGSPRDPAPARLARVAAPPGGVADLPRADRARRRHPRLPRPGLRAARHRAALHALRRRLGRDRPAPRTWSSAASSARSTDAVARHLDPAIASSVRRCISSSDMSSVCVASIQRWPYGSRSEPARSPWNWSDGRLTRSRPPRSRRVVERVDVLGVDQDRGRDRLVRLRRAQPEVLERVARPRRSSRRSAARSA